MLDDALLKPQQVADLLQVHAVTLARWRAENRGPAWIEVEGQCRYRREEVTRWLAENTKNGAANANS
jgi:predicted site-specific integrase-resolvase